MMTLMRLVSRQQKRVKQRKLELDCRFETNARLQINTQTINKQINTNTINKKYKQIQTSTTQTNTSTNTQNQTQTSTSKIFIKS